MFFAFEWQARVRNAQKQGTRASLRSQQQAQQAEHSTELDIIWLTYRKEPTPLLYVEVAFLKGVWDSVRPQVVNADQ